MWTRRRTSGLAEDWNGSAMAARVAVSEIDERTAYAGFSMGSVFGVSTSRRSASTPPDAVSTVGGLRGADARGDATQNAPMRTAGGRGSWTATS